MARLIDWQAIQNIDKGGNVIVAMSTLQALFLQACSAFYENEYTWVYGSNPVTNEQWDAIEALQADTELALMGNMVGLILPNVLADISDIGVLDCNGDIYLRVDYPLLYAAIAPTYIIDADSFAVPDLRDRFPAGASATLPIGTTGGQEDITLDVSEMPNHGHTTLPHTHAESGAVTNVMSVTAGIPAPSALPLPTVTGATVVTVNNTGGDGAHNNIPPYVSISYVIVSG